MFKFDMSVDQNFAIFVDAERGWRAVAESFDNEEFSVRLLPLAGDFDGGLDLGAARASNDEELNEKLGSMVERAISQQARG